jgi:hypothetical protein
MADVWYVSGEASTTLFFVVWVVVGKYTLLSLFLAVIMEAFETAQTNQELARQNWDPSDAKLKAVAQSLVTKLPPPEGMLHYDNFHLPI